MKMPPPTLANRAMELAPKPNPATTVMSWKMAYRMVTPRRPIPTTVTPITVPLEKAIRKAGFRPWIAAVAVLTFARTATLMPTNPATAEQIVPAR